MLVDIHFDQLDPALGGQHGLFQRRRQLLARTAPRRPEVDQDRLALGFFDDVLHERLGGGVLDEVGAGLRRRAIALFNYRHGDLVCVSIGPFSTASPLDGPRPGDLQSDRRAAALAPFAAPHRRFPHGPQMACCIRRAHLA